MATKAASRTLNSFTRRARPSCQCLGSTSTRKIPLRQISASSNRSEPEYEVENESRPRWSYTPKAMQAPYSIKPKDPAKAWQCNSDPVLLDQFYVRFLGRGGDSVLTEDVKWLAVTHKSFDQGRRGFNDRLAFLGRRIINLQATMALLHSPIATQTQTLSAADRKDQLDREPFRHPALEGLTNLTNTPISVILTKQRLAQLGTQAGLREVLRWKPKMPESMEKSGIDVVLTSTLYAIVGAISLQRGTEAANQVTREKILKPLGLL